MIERITKENKRHYDGTDLAVLSFALGLLGAGVEFNLLMTFINIGVNEKIGITDALDLISLKIKKSYKQLSVSLGKMNRIISLYQIFDSSKETSVKLGDWYIKIVLDHSYGQKPTVRGHVEAKEFETYYNKKYVMKGSELTHYF